MVTGLTPAVAAVFHPMGAPSASRVVIGLIGVMLAALGRMLINWGGLASVGIGGLNFDLTGVGIATGVIGGCLNIDRSMQFGDRR